MGDGKGIGKVMEDGRGMGDGRGIGKVMEEVR